MSNIFKGIKAFFRQADLALLILSLLASAYGIVLIVSATRSYGTQSYILVQLGAVFIGVIAFLLLSWLDLDALGDMWKYLYAINLILIGSLLIFGTGGAETGNKSWIRFGRIGIQPAEFGKVLFILTLSCRVSQLKSEISSAKSVLRLIVHAAIPILLIVLVSKDYGMATVYAVIFVIVMFCSGVKLRWFAGAGALIGASAPFIWKYLLVKYQRLRILVVFNPELDPLGKGYHAIQSKIALGAGQLFGRGLFNGTQTQYGYLPAKHTDFIFAVAGEELGMIGCFVILALLVAIIIRCILSATRSSDGSVARAVCVSVCAMLVFQTFENIGMCVGLMPIIGLTLPLFSYGGSSILTVFACLGLVSAARNRSDTRTYLT